MTKLASRQLIDAFWESQLGYSPVDFTQPRVHLLKLAGSYSGYHGAFCLRRHRACLVFVPDALLSSVGEKLSGKDPEEVFQVPTLEALFGDRVEKTIGPALYAYADTSDLKSWGTRGARRLGEADLPLTRAFLASLPEAEREVSGLSVETPVLVGVFEGATLGALAGYDLWGRKLAHVGIVTHPEWRGKGMAKRSLSALARHAVEEGRILQYRTLLSNGASVAIARTLGFQDQASSIALRFRPT